jgi:hypothetical protein
MMNVQFDFSIDDLLDVTDRTLTRNRLAGHWRLRDWFSWTASGCFGALLIFLTGRERQPLAWTLIVGVLASEVYVARLLRRDRLRRYLREQCGGDGPFRCEASIDADGLYVTQFGSTSTRRWPEIDRIVDAATGVEFVSQDRVTCIRNRAFPTDVERRDFLSRARGFHANSEQKQR